MLAKKGTTMLSKLVWIFLLIAAPTALFAQEPFYKGKTIRIIVGFSAGGGFDTYARVIARHMGKHIPGEPTIIVENMAGAGSLIAANHGFNSAKPDGLTINNWIGGLVLQAVLGGKGINFDAPKFEWVGALQDSQSCGLTKASGISDIQDWLAAKKPVKLGGTASGSTDVDIPRILKATLALPIQLVEGYKGTADIRIAADSGEVSGYCGTWAGMKSTWSQALESGNATVMVQINSKKHPDLMNVPNAVDLATTDEARDLIRMGIHYQADISRNYSLPPATPKERVSILQKAFMQTMKDKDFLAEAQKAKLSVQPISGDEVGRIVADYSAMRPELIAKLKEIMLSK
jgi:tripartite-type tricarboxylate transporter receptor subunit TctC